LCTSNSVGVVHSETIPRAGRSFRLRPAILDMAPSVSLPGVLLPCGCVHGYPCDSPLFCSDGLTVARDARDEEFGLEGLERVRLEYLDAAPLELLEHVFSAIDAFSGDTRQWDNMTAAVFHYAQPSRKTRTAIPLQTGHSVDDSN